MACGVGIGRAAIVDVEDAVVVAIGVTSVANAIVVGIGLLWVWDVWAVVGGVWDTVIIIVRVACVAAVIGAISIILIVVGYGATVILGI